MSITIEDLIGDGRVRTRPYHTYGAPTVLTINLDLLATKLYESMLSAYRYHEPLRNLYSGNIAGITAAIQADVLATTSYACFCCYNRLRAIAERYSMNVRTARMNPRAPVSNRMEFPSYVSSFLSSIGPLRITDAPADMLVIYASTSATMNHYGRAAAIAPVEGHYNRLLGCLRTLNVATSPLDYNAAEGAYWSTTIAITNEDQLYSVLGTVHQCHYTNDDVLRSLFLYHQIENPIFEDIGSTIGYVNNPAVLTALAAAEAPPRTPPGTVTATEGRPVAALYNVNYLGIRPPVAAQGDHPAQTAGIYILGRGDDRIYTCYLAEHITLFEIQQLVRQALIARAAPRATA